MTIDLHDKTAEIEKIATQALENQAFLTELLDGLKSREETFRYNCYKALLSISKTHGEVLYPYWDRFAASMDSENSYHKMAAVHLIANLTAVDKDKKFERIFNKYYILLDDKSIIVAYYVANVSGKIINARPELDLKITERLLDIDRTHHPASRKELIKTGIIEAFNDYYENYPGKSAILDFVRRQVNSPSNKTKKAAKAFLARWDK